MTTARHAAANPGQRQRRRQQRRRLAREELAAVLVIAAVLVVTLVLLGVEWLAQSQPPQPAALASVPALTVHLPEVPA